MISNFFWRLASTIIRFIRIFDTDISAGGLWKIRIHKLVNCWAMPPKNFLYSATAYCRYIVRWNRRKEVEYAAMETPLFREIKVSDEDGPPKAVVRVYVPFKADYMTIQLKVANWVDDHEEYLTKTVDVHNLSHGIHHVTIDLKVILQHYKEKGFNA